MRFVTLLFLLVVLGLTSIFVASACSHPGGVAPAADAALPLLEGTPPALIPTNSQVDAVSSPVLYDTLRGTVWTANGDVGTISEVDIDSFTVLAEIPIGTDIRSVAESPDGAWIAAVDRAAGTVSLVDGYTNVVARTIPVGIHPRAAVWSASDPRWLYVALEGSDEIGIVDRTLGVLAQTIAVGRMPSGLAVSRKRNELYVTHRIDPFISILDLAAGKVVDDVPLVVQPAQSDTHEPQGIPFAFEGMSWVPEPDMNLHDTGGDQIWVPHELLESTHPIQFQSTVFPAISVVDLVQRQEVQTNANDVNQGIINGRKLLFGAICLPDSQGNTSIISQPCAIVQHPNAIAVYAIACGSEDLLTFDATQGVAVSLLRNLPGDHPVGITLDALGQRMFIVSDQSHTLLAIDTDGGSVVGNLRILNGGNPLSVVAKDPLDPELRAGQILFYSANGLARNAYATTGDDWLSCGACHLDGFGGGEEVLFEDLMVQNPASSAQVGHSNLVDFFSTAPTVGTSPGAFSPHDILEALVEQGGMAPDRTGVDLAGQVNPSSPPAAAAQMATQLAYVVARDLPVGPSWLSSNGAPNATDDTSFCGQCHSREYAAWQESAHSHAGADPMMLYAKGVEQGIAGPPFTRLCVGCHDPIGARTGDFSLTSGRGVSCLSCHEVDYPIRAGGNAALVATPYDWTVSHVARAQATIPMLRSPEFCGGCHALFVPGTGTRVIDTLEAWKASHFAGTQPVFPDGGVADLDAGTIPGGDSGIPPGFFEDAAPTVDAAADAPVDTAVPLYDPPQDAGQAPDSGATPCVDCHMPLDGTLADHRFIGGNVYLAETLGDGGTVAALQGNLAKAISLTAVEATGGYLVTATNVGAGHYFPNGVPDIREAWVEVDALDANNNVLLRIGGPDQNNLIPSTAARFGRDFAGVDGGVLLEHQITLATTIPFERRIPPGGAVDVFIPGQPLPPGTAQVQAVLYYRNLRTTFYRAATGDATGATPDLVMATAIIP